MCQNFPENTCSTLRITKKQITIGWKGPALLILDAFQGQITHAVKSLLADKNILFVKVPSNINHLLQQLNISVNGWAKQWMNPRFTVCYAGY